MSERRSDLKAVSAPEEVATKLAGPDMGNLTAQWLSNWGQINDRLMSLAQVSLRNSVNAAEQLRQCQSPTDMVDIQMKLARQVYDEYLDETRQLSDLVVKLSTDSLGSVCGALNNPASGPQ